MRNLKRALSLALASVMLLGMMVVGSSAAAGYSDVDDNDNVEAIEVLQTIEVMVGDERGFGPDRPVTRNEMAVVMGKLLNLNYNYYASTCPFTDVADWAKGWVGAAYANGIVSGRTATIYDGEATITAIEAASMMMRALGYFKYAEDYADGFQLATVKQGSDIGIFNGVGTDANTPMTRNQVAQMALNALRSNMVNFTGTPGMEVNGVKVGYRAEYTPRTGTEAKYNAIAGLTTTILSDNGQYFVQLGEQLYDGDLKLYDNRNDDFGRPARYWEYNGKDIGTYAKYEVMREEYTKAVDGRDLTELLGKFVIENNDVDYYLNGKVDPTIEAKTMVKANTVDYTTTGNGVLTQVFFESGAKGTDGQITIVSIDTFLAKATGDYNEKKESLSVDIWADDSATAKVGADTEIKLDEIASIEGVKKDDKFLVQVAWDGKTYQIVNKLDVDSQIDVKLNKYSEDKYLANADGQYDYAKSGKIVKTAGSPNVYYSLNQIVEYSNKALVDYTYDLYFDQYGYLIGNEIHSGENHYVFIAGYDLDGSHLATAEAKASAIFLDGTMKNIQVNVTETNKKIDTYNKKTKTAGTSAYWYPELDAGLEDYNAWFTYSTTGKEGSEVYTLTPAKNWMEFEATSAEQKINTTNLRLTQFAGLKGADKDHAGAAGTRVYGNDDSVFITVDTGKVSAGGNKIGITEVTSVYTGVQNVDLKVWKKGTADGTNQLDAKTSTSHSATSIPGAAAADWGWNSNTKVSGVFAVYNDDLYVIGAVVVGEDDTNSNNYAYVLKKVKNEYIDADNNHYWDFDAVVDGKIETLTAKGTKDTYDDLDIAFTALCGVGKNGLAKVTYDKDGYVTKLEQQNDADNTDKVYGLTDYTVEINTDKHKLYSVNYLSTTDVNNQPKAGKFIQIGRSLYNDGTIKNNTTDAGLPLATGAPVVVIRNEVYTSGSSEVVYEEYSSIEQALNALDTHKNSFEGWVSAVLNGNGTAKFIVINDKNSYSITNDDGGSHSTGLLTNVEGFETGLTASTANDTAWTNIVKNMDPGLYQSDYMKSTWSATDPKDVLLVRFDAKGTSATVTIRGDGKIWYTETATSLTKDDPYFFSIHVKNGGTHYAAGASGQLVTDGELPAGEYTVSVAGQSWNFTVK